MVSLPFCILPSVIMVVLGEANIFWGGVRCKKFENHCFRDFNLKHETCHVLFWVKTNQSASFLTVIRSSESFITNNQTNKTNMKITSWLTPVQQEMVAFTCPVTEPYCHGSLLTKSTISGTWPSTGWSVWKKRIPTSGPVAQGEEVYHFTQTLCD